MIRPPQRSTLSPYTSLFRSQLNGPWALAGALAVLGCLVSSAAEAGRPAVCPDRIVVRARRGTHRNELHQRLLAGSEEHTAELQSRSDLVCRLLLEKKKTNAG